MQIDGSIIREQGVVFGIVIVKPTAIENDTVAAETRTAFQSQVRDFAGIPLVLAAQDCRGRFEYHGRRDIVAFLARVSPSRIPWKRYTLS